MTSVVHSSAHRRRVPSKFFGQCSCTHSELVRFLGLVQSSALKQSSKLVTRYVVRLLGHIALRHTHQDHIAILAGTVAEGVHALKAPHGVTVGLCCGWSTKRRTRRCCLLMLNGVVIQLSWWSQWLRDAKEFSVSTHCPARRCTVTAGSPESVFHGRAGTVHNR